MYLCFKFTELCMEKAEAVELVRKVVQTNLALEDKDKVDLVKVVWEVWEISLVWESPMFKSMELIKR